MIRSGIFFFMFLFVYFLGMQTGNLEGKSKSVDTVEKIREESSASMEKKDTIYVYEQDVESLDLSEREDEHYTKKAAGFLESIVTGLFNFIISILYKLINIFY